MPLTASAVSPLSSYQPLACHSPDVSPGHDAHSLPRLSLPPFFIMVTPPRAPHAFNRFSGLPLVLCRNLLTASAPVTHSKLCEPFQSATLATDLPRARPAIHRAGRDSA